MQDQPYDTIIQRIRLHYHPKKKVIPQLCRFLKRIQQEGESISEYLRELKHLEINCNFSDMLRTMLRDRFMAGIKLESLQKKLLQETDDVTLDKNMPRRSRPLIGRNTAASRRYRNAIAIETPLQSATRRALRRLRYSEARVAAAKTMQVPVQRIQLWTHKPFSGLQYNTHIDYTADSSVDIGQMSRYFFNMEAEIVIFEQYLVKIDLLKEDVESQLLTGDLHVLNQTKENLYFKVESR
ncbi:hypothetical protein LAZ67_X002314 [Cordylochernes scorpioides]|uniref:Retrotransposon gag domain-containing protein n=1 Tax=Cordylochernes scorpioides TaxID=51811 RepID=A0ABY6LTQ7_9ARAC|nr:hypothetical protein LAZ67_X002314 [Cordylochernes scorpioides]